MIDIDERLNLYSEIYAKAYQIASKANPENARYVASEIFKEIARDLRSELISELRKENGNVPETKREMPATEKQRSALHKFGIANIPESLTKKEAYEILNSLISLSREGNKEAIK